MSGAGLERGPPPPAARRQAWRKLALRGALTVAVLAVLFTFVPVAQMRAALERVSLLRWGLILLGMLALHALAALKWRMFVTASGVRCNVADALRAHGAGLFANLFLPGLVATDVVRAAMLARAGNATAPVAMGSVADRLVDTGSLVVLGSLGAAIATGGGIYWATPAAVAVALVAGSAVAVPVLRFLRGERFPAQVRSMAEKLDQARATLVRQPRVAAAAALASIGVQAGMVLLAVAMGRAVGIEVSLAAWFLAWPIAKLTILIPLTISGLGVREAALAGLLLPFGVDPAVAVAQGLVWQSVQVGLALVAGAAAYGSRHWRVSDRTSTESKPA